MSVTYHYDVPDVMCGNCSGTIERALRASSMFRLIPLGVDPIEKNLTITFEEDQLSYLEARDLINAVIQEVGFNCVAKTLKQGVRVSNSQFSHYFQAALGIGLGALLLIMSFVVQPLPFIGMAVIAAFSLPLNIFLGLESYQRAWKKLKNASLTMDTLFSMSSLTILIVSTAAFFFTSLPMMYEAGLLIFGFRHLGLAIEHAFKRTSIVTARFQDDAPKNVFRRHAGKVSSVPLASIQKKDQLILTQGSILPVDGFFEEDEGLICDRIITGSSQPRRIVRGEQLYAGTVIIQAKRKLNFRATAAAIDSHLVRLDTKIARAKLEKTEIETVTHRILQYFIPVVLSLAIISGVLIGCFFSVALGIQCAVSLLVSACPCTLGLITPLAVKIGMKKAADAGVVYNSAKHLEATQGVQVVVFDLNGTLTYGEPKVVQYRALKNSAMSDQELLGLLAHFEADSPHPIAKAICAKAHSQRIKPSNSPVSVQMTNHAGLVVQWEKHTYTLGGETFMLKRGIKPQDLEAIQNIIKPKHGDRVVYLARGSQLMGYVVLHDLLREHAHAVVSELQSQNIQVFLSTGSDRKTALAHARFLGIPEQHVRANCVSHAPADSRLSKKNFIDALKKQGYRVAVVGDGANDAEMIAAADVGFALSVGADEHTRQQAAAVIHGHSLLPVLHGFKIARQTVTNIKQNLLFSLFYNIATVMVTCGLLLSWGIALNPAVGAALMIIQTSLILLNVVRFANQRLATDQKSSEPAPAINSQTKMLSLIPKIKPKVSLNLQSSSTPKTIIKDKNDIVKIDDQSKLTTNPHTDITSIRNGMRFADA